MPLPRERSWDWRISGIAPYLAGTKNAECMPMRNTHDSTSHGPVRQSHTPSQKPSVATSMMPTSASFQKTSELRLL